MVNIEGLDIDINEPCKSNTSPLNLFNKLVSETPKELRQTENWNPVFLTNTKRYLEIRYKGTFLGEKVDSYLRKRDYQLFVLGIPIVVMEQWDLLDTDNVALTVKGNSNNF